MQLIPRVPPSYLRPTYPQMTMMRTPYALCASVILLCTATRVAAQIPENDACSTPIVLICGQTFEGATTEATVDPQAINCYTSIQAPGVWYSIVGTGEVIVLSTCNGFTYDTKINVYRGTCGALVCTAGNDDGGDCATGSTIGFTSAAGTEYLILVQGYQGEVGDFELSVACGPVTNDYCAGALPIGCNESISGSTLESSGDNAPFCGTGIQAPGVWFTFTGISDPIQLSTCENFDYDTRMNLYRGTCDGLTCVLGNDDTDGVGECSTLFLVPDPAATYYVLVQGYDGQVGTFALELACQACAGPSDIVSSATDASAFVYWESLNPGSTYSIEYGPVGFIQGTGTVLTGTVNGPTPVAEITGLDPGTDYAFYLHEECGPGQVSQTVGPFEFTTLPEAPPANANCGGALPIACDEQIDGDTELSFYQPGITCGAANITSEGLWYTFTGTGQTVTLSTCGAADFDTKISIYSGLCTGPICVAGADDAPDCSANTTVVSFPTTDGDTYLALVHGYQDQTGTFTLAMTCTPSCAPVAANDECANATILTSVGIGQCEVVQGSNECAFATGVPNPPCDPFAPIIDVWYTFNSDDRTTHTAIFTTLTAEFVSAALYADCGSLTYIDCVTEVNDPMVFTDLEPGTDYYLRVWNGGGNQAGTFEMCIESDVTTSVTTTASVPGVRVYPNPANDQVTIEGSTAGRIVVIDLQGRTVLRSSRNGAALVQVDISWLAPGSYLLRTLDGTGGMLGRFTKE